MRYSVCMIDVEVCFFVVLNSNHVLVVYFSQPPESAKNIMVADGISASWIVRVLSLQPGQGGLIKKLYSAVWPGPGTYIEQIALSLSLSIRVPVAERTESE